MSLIARLIGHFLFADPCLHFDLKLEKKSTPDGESRSKLDSIWWDFLSFCPSN